MSEVLQTNIFFIITSVSVVVITILLAIALWKIIRILGVVRDITERVKQGTEELSDDIGAVREFLSSSFLGNIIKMMSGTSQEERKEKKAARKAAKKKSASGKKSGVLEIKEE